MALMLPMRAIPLTRGMIAMVDDSDYEWLNQWKWFAQMCDGRLYAARSVWDGKIKKKTMIYMHRFILNSPKGIKVDHEDRDTMNCSRANLRLADDSQNSMNQKRSKKSTSGFKGVCWHRRMNKWMARIHSYHKQIVIGYFDNASDAAKAYNDAAIKYHGEFAVLNIIPACA
jgi:hypothetical protein